jgi:hypothetical protein
VANRFHLSLNLSTAVEQEPARHRSFLSLPRSIGTSTASLECSASASEVVRNGQRIVYEQRVAKQALFETVQALHAAGKTVSSIVRERFFTRQKQNQSFKLSCRIVSVGGLGLRQAFKFPY